MNFFKKALTFFNQLLHRKAPIQETKKDASCFIRQNPAIVVEQPESNDSSSIKLNLSIETRIEPSDETEINVSVSVTSKRKRVRKVNKHRAGRYDPRFVGYYVFTKDGKKSRNESERYCGVYRKEITVPQDSLLLRAEFIEETDEPIFGDAAWISPSEGQIKRYYMLCHKCDELGITYNRRDRPESFDEYRLAISSLQRLLGRLKSNQCVVG